MIERLLGKVNLAKMASLAFFNQPNDIAVSVSSILSIPDDRNPAPDKHVVACDHITYFGADGGLPDLKRILVNA